MLKTASASAEISLTQEIMADGVVTTEEQARYLKHIGIQAVIDGNQRIQVVPTSPIATKSKRVKLEELGLDKASPLTYAQAQQQLAHIAKKLNRLDDQIAVQRLVALSPTQEEVDVLNALIAQLPETVKPLSIANALT
ncbi:hypothetical protein EXT46_01310 [Pseudoalteromonas sp. CO325X]|uniref:hypothetical protein n=1 Tax=Pseudoalteromonas sp. CO325X TaxID=1777262 RepID=UPI001022DD68|nr:hypothetical protein [Pseudoalteromonas sp. CO325X]RZF88115.1 hypothetical protein EXT46_01310 [Pseudoalteromonas sp. CO325X]